MNFRGSATEDQFVKYVEDNPILWDNRCQDYKDCKEKALVWDSVGNACGITGEQARLKWVSLREKYRREKLYWENIEKNGNSSNTPLKELWPLMKKMKFIDAVSTRRHSYRKIMKMEGNNNNSTCVSFHSPTYSPNISLTTSPQNFSSAMQMLEPLDNDEQTHFLMNNSYNGMADDSDHTMDVEYNSLDINKTKFQSFGIYIGNELCSLRNDVAEELHERLLTEILKFKRELRKTNCVEM
ncbi:CLUMA_CG004402, isoform A [Clunio marinus]|uniref:CLUMA_CG004402, isoform A n=1 Tax=Clunio marinus TaxID=568069 RepID=A0A1J1HRR0_9DIPT|nr:CLUMA_CG004402, isoform A [Clunio marinus]